jgi:hypothetical protein
MKQKTNRYELHKRTVPVVEITWLDHWSSSDWRPIDEADSKLLVCHSVGYLIAETKDTYTLAQSHAQSSMNAWAGVHAIAKALVIKKKVLSKV